MVRLFRAVRDPRIWLLTGLTLTLGHSSWIWGICALTTQSGMALSLRRHEWAHFWNWWAGAAFATVAGTAIYFAFKGNTVASLTLAWCAVEFLRLALEDRRFQDLRRHTREYR